MPHSNKEYPADVMRPALRLAPLQPCTSELALFSLFLKHQTGFVSPDSTHTQ